MEYHCGDCKVDFENINPDGSCPDCYSALAVERRDHKKDGKTPGTEERPDQKNSITSHSALGAPFALRDSSGWNSVHEENVLRGPHHHSARLPTMQAGLSNGNQPFRPPNRHFSRGHIGMVHGNTVWPAGLVPRFSDRVIHGDSRGQPPLVDHRVDHSAQTDVSLAEQLARIVEQLRVPILSELEASRDVEVLYSRADHLQKAVETMDAIKSQFEGRVKTVLGGEISLKQMVYGLEKKSPFLPPIDATERKRRERKKTATVTTIVVKDLPPLTTKGELFRYFSKYCDDISDLKNVNIAATRGHAYITLAHHSIVGKILSELQEHKIKNSVVAVSAFDEEEQVKRRLNYKIFVGGLSSFTSDEAFEDFLWENYGKLDGLWYHPNLQNPGVNNAYAYINFEDQKINEDILTTGHITYNGRKVYCKPFTQQRDYLDAKKRDGTFGANWRDRSATVAPPIGRVTRDRISSSSKLDSDDAAVAKDAKNGKDVRPENKPRDRHARTDNEQSGTLCLVCYTNEICIALKPCGHTCLCEACAENMDTCPYCRVAVSRKEKIYLVGSA